MTLGKRRQHTGFCCKLTAAGCMLPVQKTGALGNIECVRSSDRPPLVIAIKDKHEHDAELSRNYFAPTGLLEGPGLPGAAALQRPGRRRHDESGDGPACPRSGALERGLRGTQHPS